MLFNELIKQIEESLKITNSSEFSRATFPEGEISFKEKKLNEKDYIEMHIQIKINYQVKGYASEKIKELIKQLNKDIFYEIF